MISEESYNALKQMPKGKTVASDMLPESFRHDYNRIELLKNEGLLCPVTLLPTGKEDEYPYGLTGYYISAKGLDAVAEFEQSRSKNTEEKIQRQFQKKLGILGVLIPLVIFIISFVLERCTFMLR